MPWRDPNPGQRAMVRGASNQDVAILKEALRRLGRLSPENTTPEFDGPAYAAIRQLQAETGMDVDGIAGPQVRMVLSSWLPEYRTPALREDWAADIRAAAAPPPASERTEAPLDDRGAAAELPAPADDLARDPGQAGTAPTAGQAEPEAGPPADTATIEEVEPEAGRLAEDDPSEEAEPEAGPPAEAETSAEPAAESSPAVEPAGEDVKQDEPELAPGPAEVQSAPDTLPAPQAAGPGPSAARSRRKEATEPVPASAPLVPVTAAQIE